MNSPYREPGERPVYEDEVNEDYKRYVLEQEIAQQLLEFMHKAMKIRI